MTLLTDEQLIKKYNMKVEVSKITLKDQTGAHIFVLFDHTCIIFLCLYDIGNVLALYRPALLIAVTVTKCLFVASKPVTLISVLLVLVGDKILVPPSIVPKKRKQYIHFTHVKSFNLH